VSYLRVSIGSSDMNERVYSYDDVPAGETDAEMAEVQPGAGPRGGDSGAEGDSGNSALDQDPGSAVVCSRRGMKTTHDVKGGELKPGITARTAKYL